MYQTVGGCLCRLGINFGFFHYTTRTCVPKFMALCGIVAKYLTHSHKSKPHSCTRGNVTKVSMTQVLATLNLCDTFYDNPSNGWTDWTKVVYSEVLQSHWQCSKLKIRLLKVLILTILHSNRTLFV